MNPPPSDYYDQDNSTNVCFLCGNPSYELVHEVTHFGFPFRFQRCACGIEKQTPMPNERFFEWFFNSEVFYSAKNSKKSAIWGYYDYFKDEGCRLATSRGRYRDLGDVFEVGRPLQVMKIGPSTGTFLHIARQHGHQAIGCDVSNDFVDYARRTYGVEIHRGRFEQKDYPAASFDVILLFNVIENIPNLEAFLPAIHRTLKPGGSFIFNYVDMKRNLIHAVQKDRYFLYRPPICYIFDRVVMAKVLRRFGFEMVRVQRDVRYMHLEKIFTLLGWPIASRVARFFRIDRIPFPIFAYPSKMVVTRRASAAA